MRRCRLTICVLLLSLVPAALSAQSLGAVARKFREERREQPNPHLKVYTNDDLQTPVERMSAGPEQESAKPETSASGKEEPAAKDAKKTLSPEQEMEQRTNDVNKEYLGRIAKIRDQITQTQKDLAKLQRDQVETTNQFRVSNGISPSVAEYQQAMKTFADQIEADKRQLDSLKSDLDDAQEAARHAGVPHVYD